MYTAPANWIEIFSGAHRTEYKLSIGGVEYTEDYIQDVPKLTRPLMDVPAIGRVCSATLVVTVRERAGITINTAAEVLFYCRLTNATAQTDWVPLGKFLISSRRKGNGVITLTCRDFMLKTGRTYFDKSVFSEWPQSYASVASEIASIIGVEIDPRSNIPSGDAFMVDTWGDDVLMSEVLAGIGAGSGGNWVMTGEGKLRLVPFIKTAVQGASGDIVSIDTVAGHFNLWSDAGPISIVYRGVGADSTVPAGDIVTIETLDGEQYHVWSDAGPISVTYEAVGTPNMALGKNYQKLTLLEKGAQHVSKVILVVQEDEEYAAGETGIENGIVIEASCPFATQATANAVYQRLRGEGGWYLPITVEGAYLDPLLEPGDLITVTERDGTVQYVTLNSMDTVCNVSFQTAVSSGLEPETEDEYPYETTREIQAKRAVKTSSKYYGNSITHSEGFKSEHESGAYAQFNADLIRFVDEHGNDCFYYDMQAGTFIVAASATPDVYTQLSLAQDGLTVLAGKVDQISVGGRNLIRWSNAPYSNTDAPTATYFYGDSTPEEGEEVTLQINGAAGDDAAFTVYNTGENGVEVELISLTSESYDDTTGVYRATFNWKITDGTNTAENTMLKVYSTPTDNTRTATINWIKLERGNQATDWSPAPEDQAEAAEAAGAAAENAQASADAAQVVTRQIEARMQFTVAGLKISGTEASRDNSYVLVAADKQTFVVDDVEVMGLGADGVKTQGDIAAEGNIKGGAFGTGHWTITENASHVWSLNYHT